jgi:CLIP-associating protein 1/2
MDDGDELEGLLTALDGALTAEKRVTALTFIQSYISQADEIHSADQLTTSLKTQLKNQNHLVSTLTLSILPTYVSKIVSISSQRHPNKAHDVRSLLNSLLAVVLEKVGDQKEKTREGAKSTIVELAKAAFAVSPPIGSALAKDPHSVVALFEKIVKESGLLAKSAKVKEHVSRTETW